MTDYLQVFTTIDNKEDAQKIARVLVEKRLAACVQVNGPVTSTFRWKDRIDQEEEWVLVIKTRTGLYQEMESAIQENHTYDVPEIIACPIVEGNRDYLNWLDAETRLPHRLDRA